MAKYRARITRTYGDVQATFEIENDIEGDMNELGDKVNGATLLLNAMHERFASELLPQMNPTITQSNDTGGTQSVVIDVTKIERNRQGGVDRIRVFGGNYQKWGVPAYPEMIDQSPLLTSMIKQGDDVAHPEGYKATIQVVNGKPKRVTALALQPQVNNA